MMNWKKLLPAHGRLMPFWLLALVGLASPWIIDRWRGTHAEATSTGPCTVLDVHDGDTLNADCPEGRLRVRLACIDAPEIAQAPWGERSRDTLRGITPKAVYLRIQTTDKYGRKVAEVLTMDGDNLNLRMVRDGQAAVYRQYCKDSAFTRAEAEAKTAGRGIWATPGEQQTPWAFRHRR